MEIPNFHFGFSTLFYIHFGISTNFPGFLAGFYKTLNPTDLPPGELWTNENEGPIGEFTELSKISINWIRSTKEF
jgi:hypothetical protein